MDTHRSRKLPIWRLTIVFQRALAFSCMALSLTLFVGCQTKQRANPVDPGGTSFEMPSVSFIACPDSNQILSIDSVTFAWKGNSSASVYRFGLVNSLSGQVYYPSTQYSSDWDTTRYAVFQHLDDSPYQFVLVTEYAGAGGYTTTYAKPFMVKTVAVPAILFVKKYTDVNAGSEFEIDVWVDGVQRVFAGDLAIAFDTKYLQLVTVAEGTLPEASGLTQMLVPDFGLSKVVSSANSLGEIDLSTAFLGSSSVGDTAISGTGSILKLTFTAVAAGQTSLSFRRANLRDVDDDPLVVGYGQVATVDVK